MRSYKSDIINTSKIHTPALVLSTLFLAALLAYNTLQSWQHEQSRFQQEVEQTVNNYVLQSTLLAQASYRTNSIVTTTRNSLINQVLNDPENSQRLLRLDNAVQEAIFNYTGYFIFNNQGELLLNSGSALNPTEADDLWPNISRNKIREGLFILRYGDTGGFYFYNRFSTAEHKNLYFVSRRSYSNLSDIIYKGDFNNFELVLLDNRDQSISIRKKQFINTHNQLHLSEQELKRIVYRTPITLTHWDVVALSTQAPQKLWQLIKQPVYILLTYLLLNILLWFLLNYQRKKTLLIWNQHSRHEQFSNQVLDAISDVIIATDPLGNIQYTNSQARLLLTQLGYTDLEHANLKSLLPNEAALWNKDLTHIELKESNQNTHAISFPVHNQTVSYEQSSSLLYTNNKVSSYVWLLHDITSETIHKQTAALNEERYKALFNEAGVGHCVFDTGNLHSGRIKLVDANESAIQMAEASSKKYFLNNVDRLSATNETPFSGAIKDALRQGLARVEFQLDIQTFKGNVRHLWVTANLNLNLELNTYILASFTDITEQTKASLIVQEREIFWEKVMASIPNVVYIIRPDPESFHQPIYYNRSLSELLGYPAPTSMESSWLNHVLSEDHEHVRQIIKTADLLQKKEVLELTARFYHADGGIRILKFHNTPFEHEDGKVTRYIGLARDITEEFEQQEIILESERRYRLLTENISDIIWTTDIHLQFNFVSPSVFKVLGYTPAELMTSDFNETFHPKDIMEIRKRLERSILTVKNETIGNHPSHHVMVKKDLRARQKDGTNVLLEVQASPLWNDAKELIGFVGTSRDVTLARQMDDELKLSAEVFANTNEAIIITDANLNVVQFNPAFFHTTGYSSKQLIGKKPSFLVTSEQYTAEFVGTIQSTLESDGYWQGEINYRHANGSVRTGWAGISALLNKDQEVQRLIFVLSDVTEKKNIEADIHRLAYFDSLTGLANRTLLNEHLRKMLESAQQNDEAFALLFLDLDRFKPINDTMGHPAGDLVLKEVASRLLNSVKHKDLVCRMGGDEFTIALTPQPNIKMAGDVANYVGQRILNLLSRPYFVNEQEVFLSGSIGIAVYPQDGRTVTELLKNADMAMYHAKDLGRNNLQFFMLSMNEKAKSQLELENDLRHALGRNEFVLHYQSQHATDSSVAVAAEALLRWNHPTKGLLPPNHFIPVLEDSGLIVNVGQWVLKQACEQFVQWHQQDLGLQRIAVNVSARQFHQVDFLNMVRDTIRQTGIEGHQLELELTESILMQDLDHTLKILNSLRALGVRIAIDDFGTGYSSLNYLKQFPVDTLKIDRIFIQNLPENADDAQITRTIIAMAHNLGMSVIAEGVETTAQLTFLQSTQCEETQGFLFSKPLPPNELRQHLQKKS